jgi:hypothetical protein
VQRVRFKNSINSKNSGQAEKENSEKDVVSVFQENNSNNYTAKNSNIRNDENGNLVTSSSYKNICSILEQKVYLFSALSLSCLLFIITTVQFWTTYYMEKNFANECEINRIISYSMVCILSPTLGILLGARFNSYYGAYESKKSLMICLILAILSASCSIPVPFCNKLLYFSTFLWLVLFFGAAILPQLMGIMVSRLPHRLMGSANSVTCFISIALGYLPAPYAYGAIDLYLNGSYDRIAIACIMYYSWIGVILLAIASYIRYKEINENNDSSVNLIERRTIRETVISNGICKIFGNSMNFDCEQRFYEEENLINYVTPKKKIIKVNNKSMSSTPSIDDYDEEENEDIVEEYFTNDNEIFKKQITSNSSKENTIATPFFNVLQYGSNDFDYTRSQIDLSNIPYSIREESVFAPKVFIQINSESLEKENISNLNIEQISKSFGNKKDENVLVIEENNRSDGNSNDKFIFKSI